MSNRTRAFIESKTLHHSIVAVIVLAGVVAGLETNPIAAERERAQHERDTGSAMQEDELKLLEREMKEMQAQLAGLRRRGSNEPQRLLAE